MARRSVNRTRSGPGPADHRGGRSAVSFLQMFTAPPWATAPAGWYSPCHETADPADAGVPAPGGRAAGGDHPVLLRIVGARPPPDRRDRIGASGRGDEPAHDGRHRGFEPADRPSRDAAVP